MDTYEALAKTVQINNNNLLLNYDDSLIHVGTGRSAFVFRIKSTMKAMKVFFPSLTHIAREEAEIYRKLQGCCLLSNRLCNRCEFYRNGLY